MHLLCMQIFCTECIYGHTCLHVIVSATPTVGTERNGSQRTRKQKKELESISCHACPVFVTGALTASVKTPTHFQYHAANTFYFVPFNLFH